MSSFARFIGLSVLILILFFVVAFITQGWLQREHQRVEREASDAKRRQFHAAVQHIGSISPDNLASHLDSIGTLIDAQITLHPQGSPLLKSSTGLIVVREPLSDLFGQDAPDAFIAYRLSQVAQLGLLHGRTWSLLLIGALAAMFFFVLLGLFFTRRPTGAHGSRPPWASIRSEMNSLEQISKTSVDRGNQLATERDNRKRIEENLTLTQKLQAQVLEEKTQLGRDLHDDVIQSLYAVGLTLEAARVSLNHNPEAADQQIQQCLNALNASIRDVRGYIKGLSPDRLRQRNFAQAVETLADELQAGREVTWEHVIDEEAAAALSFEQTTEALQITREAISNALRHGQADQVTVRLHRNDTEVGLLISDNGHGFKPDKTSGDGHGLGNMQSRAARIGATLRIDSHTKTGTRIVVTFPVSHIT